MATITPFEANATQGYHPVNQARDVHVSDHGQVHIGNNYGTTAQSELHRRQNKFLKRLSTVPYEDRKNVNPLRVPGTCGWFLAHPFYRQWREGSCPMLWISAEAGCGKSVLARFLVDEELPNGLESGSEPPKTICYFFFKDGVEDQRTLQAALRCILKQLLSQKRTLLSHSILDRFETESHLSATTLWRLLMQAMSRPEAGSTLCLLDAVDECEEESRHELYKLVETFLNVQEKAEMSQFKLLLTSRPTTDLRNGLANLPIIHLEGETDEEVDKIAEEIELVIKKRIDLICERYRVSLKQKNSLQSRLLSVQNRTYLWAHLTLDLIDKDLLAGRREVLTSKMELPQTVEAAYDRMLTKSHSPVLAKKLLQIVLAATRPLSVAELAAVVELSSGSNREEDLSMLTQDEYAHHIRGLCGLFTIVGSKVALLHQTVREFLIRDTESQTIHTVTSGIAETTACLRWRQSISLQESHHMLAQTCIDILISSQELVLKHDEGHLWQNRYVSLRRYAAMNWHSHARKSGYSNVGKMRKLCEAPEGHHRHPVWVDYYLSQRQGPEDGQDLWPLTPIQISAMCGVLLLTRELLLTRDLAEVHTSFPTPFEPALASRRSAVILAVERGYCDIIQEILNYFPTPLRHLLRDNPMESRDIAHRTPLGVAAQHGHLEIVEFLLKEGASVETYDQDGSSPLVHAYCSGETAVVDLIRQHDQSPGRLNVLEHLKILLMKAIIKGRKRIAQGILATGSVDLNENIYEALDFENLLSHESKDWTLEKLRSKGPTCWPSTYLSLACFCGQSDIARLLMEKGAKWEGCDKYGFSLLHWASTGDQYDTTLLLMEMGFDIDQETNSGLRPICLCSDFQVMQALFDAGASIPQMEKSSQEWQQFVKTVLQQCRPPTKAIRTISGLYFRARRRLTDDRILKDIARVLPVICGRADLLEEVFQMDQISKPDSCLNDWNLLHFAAAFEQPATDCLEKLLSIGAQALLRNLQGESPMDIAAQFHNKDSLDVLMRQPTVQASIRDNDPDSSTWNMFIDYSFRSGDDTPILALIEHGADFRRFSFTTIRSLVFAPDHTVLNILKLLLSNKADPAQLHPLLFDIISKPYAQEVFLLLFAYKANPNQTIRPSKTTLLHSLASVKDSHALIGNLASLVLSAGASTSLTDERGLTPLALARQVNRNPHLISLLENAVHAMHAMHPSTGAEVHTSDKESGVILQARSRWLTFHEWSEMT